MMNTRYFSHFISITLLLIISLAFSHCTKEGEDYYFDESYLLGTWVSDNYDTFDGESHEALSRLDFLTSVAFLNGNTTPYPWSILEYGEIFPSYQGSDITYRTLNLGSASFQILELTKTKFSFIEKRNNQNQIWYYTRE